MRVSEECAELAHRASTEGEGVVLSDAMDDAGVRFGKLKWRNDMSSGG